MKSTVSVENLKKMVITIAKKNLFEIFFRRFLQFEQWIQ